MKPKDPQDTRECLTITKQQNCKYFNDTAAVADKKEAGHRRRMDVPRHVSFIRKSTKSDHAYRRNAKICSGGGREMSSDWRRC
jgi:hypothetical protein